MNEQRRSFLGWAVHGLGALFGVVLGVPLGAYLVDARNRPARQSGFKTVEGVRPSELQVNEPRQGVIRDVRRDAWTLHPNDVVGRVWVVKYGSGDQELRVFTTICPHLGCSINCNADNQGFTCPCHGGEFALAGALVERPGYSNPAPRGMDTLEWQIDRDNDLIQVKYQSFYQGKHEKVAKV